MISRKDLSLIGQRVAKTQMSLAKLFWIVFGAACFASVVRLLGPYAILICVPLTPSIFNSCRRIVGLQTQPLHLVLLDTLPFAVIAGTCVTVCTYCVAIYLFAFAIIITFLFQPKTRTEVGRSQGTTIATPAISTLESD